MFCVFVFCVFVVLVGARLAGWESLGVAGRCLESLGVAEITLNGWLHTVVLLF